MWADRRGAFPNPIESERKSWHAPSRSSPANGPTCRSTELAPQGQELRLRRPGTGLLGRSLRRRSRPCKTRPTCKDKWELLDEHGLQLLRHLQPPRRPGDLRPTSTSATRRSCPPDVWGDGDPEGVRKRAAKKMIDTAKAAASSSTRPGKAAASRPSSTASPARASGTRSTPSRPPPRSTGEKGFDDFAKRFDADPRRVRQGRT